MWRSQRSLSSVVITASPTAPPRLRIRLKRPDAFLIRSGGSVPSASTLTGIIAIISRDAAQRLRDEELVERPVLGDRHQFEAGEGEQASPNASIMSAGRRFCDSAPAIGAVSIMKAPVTNIVSPICERVVAAHAGEKHGIEDRPGHRGRCRARRMKQRAGREIAVGEGLEVDDRLARRQRPRKEGDAGDHRDQREDDDGACPGTSRFSAPSSSTYSRLPRKTARSRRAPM